MKRQTIPKGNEAFAAYIKAKRVKSGNSQKDLAKKLGYTTSQFISNWERGISLPPSESLGILSAVLNVPRTEIATKIVSCLVEYNTKKLNESYGI